MCCVLCVWPGGNAISRESDAMLAAILESTADQWVGNLARTKTKVCITCLFLFLYDFSIPPLPGSGK